MTAFTKGAQAPATLGYETSLGISAQAAAEARECFASGNTGHLLAMGLKVREAPHPVDEAGSRAFVVRRADGKLVKVLVPGEDSAWFH